MRHDVIAAAEANLIAEDQKDVIESEVLGRDAAWRDIKYYFKKTNWGGMFWFIITYALSNGLKLQ